MSDLILCAKASTAKQPNSERFSGTLPAHSHHRLSVFSGIPTWPHPSSFQGPKVSSEQSCSPAGSLPTTEAGGVMDDNLVSTRMPRFCRGRPEGPGEQSPWLKPWVRWFYSCIRPEGPGGSVGRFTRAMGTLSGDNTGIARSCLVGPQFVDPGPASLRSALDWGSYPVMSALAVERVRTVATISRDLSGRILSYRGKPMAKAMGSVLTARWAVRWLAFVVMDAIETFTEE